jgi:hypothetical protein
MHLHPVLRGQFRCQFVNRQIGLRRDPALHPAFYAGQFTAPGIALRFRRERAGLAFEPNHVVDELDRHAQPPRRLCVRVALLDKPHGTFTQLYRMRFAHL